MCGKQVSQEECEKMYGQGFYCTTCSNENKAALAAIQLHTNKLLKSNPNAGTDDGAVNENINFLTEIFFWSKFNPSSQELMIENSFQKNSFIFIFTRFYYCI
jgi:hypothetical protein